MLEALLYRPRTLATLAPAFATDGRFTLPLTLCTGLLVVPALPQLRVETRALYLPLEAAQSAVEALIVLNDDFQDDHILWQIRL